MPGSLAIKYRIDGVLTTIGVMQGHDLAEQVISRIKVMSDLDIAERRIPQDGRFKVSIQGREIDFRVSIMPSIFGEDAVLRILDREALTDHVEGLTLNQLGFNQAAITSIRRLSSEPYGMLLVTGPTGSGKTTSLYAAISEVNRGDDKIITIEDPIEYQLPGVLQIPVNEKRGLPLREDCALFYGMTQTKLWWVKSVMPKQPRLRYRLHYRSPCFYHGAR